MHFFDQTYPFALLPLPYGYDALEPYIDAETLHYHHDKHLKTYVDNLNHALSSYPEYQNMTLVELLKNYPSFPEELKTKVQNNGGGVFNHNLYFYLMGGDGDISKAPELEQAIKKDFSSFEQFQDMLGTAGLNQFGSGYGWLVKNKDGHLEVIPTPNQITPLLEDAIPLLPLDVWEHAYYLKYKNMRKDYIDQWFHVIDWPKVEEIYQKFM